MTTKKSELGIISLLFIIFFMLVIIGLIIYYRSIPPEVITKIVTKNVTIPCNIPQGCNLTSEQTLRIKAQNQAIVMQQRINELELLNSKQLSKIIRIKTYLVDALSLLNITKENLFNATWNYTEKKRKAIAITALDSAERNINFAIKS